MFYQALGMSQRIQFHLPFFLFIIISGVGLSPLGTAATSGLLYKPHMIDEGDCEAIGGMKIGKGNRSTRRKPAAAPLCPPQISHDQTRAAAVGSQRLTAWAMARPSLALLQSFRITEYYGWGVEFLLCIREVAS
jgi:hypothetical protein